MAEYVPPEQQLVPALYVSNLERSGAFYRQLGFEVLRRDGIFMELRWERAALFLVELLPPSAPPPAVVGNLRIMVADLDAHWRRVQELGLEVVQPIVSRPYGLREFAVAGPDGLNLRFAGWIKNPSGPTGVE